MAPKKGERKKVDKLDRKTTPAPAPEEAIQGSVSLEISYSEILNKLVAGYGKSGTADGKKQFAEVFSKLLTQTAAKHKCASDYNIIVLYDNTILVKGDSDRIYKAISELDNNGKPLLLILLSRGGEPGSAYLIGKLCRQSSNSKFVVAVPRYAKSAATLLSCAADEIHMGSLSELGPIDLQINKMPALGLKHSIEHIAELVSKTPDSALMFAKYLSYSVEPIQIGYYERAAKSVEQYAERLLKSHETTLSDTPASVAHKLVYEYKDHGFVIDKAEAISIFGDKTIKIDSPEYQLANDMYLELSKVENLADLLGYTFYFIGGLSTAPELIKK
jgi:ClpP class serine protease